MSEDNQKSTSVQSVDRALRLLNVLGNHKSGMTLTELHKASSLDISISTVHRLMSTLMDWEYVDQNPTTKIYTLGSQLLNLGSIALRQINLDHIPLNLLQELGKKMNELVNLTKLMGNRAVYINQIQAEDRAIKLFTQIGASVPLYCTGVGKAMLAFLPENRRTQAMDCEPLQAHTINTITNRLKLIEELNRVRELGYATDNEEMEIGVRCIAAPIFRAGGDVIGAVSVSGPAGRLPQSRDKEISESVVETAWKISGHLGFKK
jgi:IclR family acetate operon transcriptional repressor